MDKVTASIIITTYNRPELFKRALKSAQNQTYKDYEIILVDDCSEMPYEVYSYPETKLDDVRYIVHETNKGLSAARNTGIKAAKGKYIVCLDDDNELMPTFLEEMIREMSVKERGLGTIIHGVTAPRIIRYKNFDDIAKIKKNSMSKFTSIDWGWLIRREVFDEILYDEDLRANEDTDFGIRWHNKGYTRISVDGPPLSIAYDTENSLSFPDERELRGMEKFCLKNMHEYDGYPDELRVLWRTMGRKFYRGGYKKIGIRNFGRSFKAKPGLNSFLNLFFIMFGWKVYNNFMTVTEYVGSKIR